MKTNQLYLLIKRKNNCKIGNEIHLMNALVFYNFIYRNIKILLGVK